MQRRPRLVIAVTVLFGSGLIELPVASPQDAQLKPLPLGDFTSANFGAEKTAAGPTSTFAKPAAPTIIRYRIINGRVYAPWQAAPSRHTGLLVALCISHGALQLLDAASTLRALRSVGAQEANPLLQPLVAHPAAFIAVKAGVGGGLIYLLARHRKDHPVKAILTIGVINAAYVYIVQRNFRDFPQR
jgi:hypothetical protein